MIYSYERLPHSGDLSCDLSCVAVAMLWHPPPPFSEWDINVGWWDGLELFPSVLIFLLLSSSSVESFSDLRL